MAEEKQNCKFFLLRYVPDAVKNEFVNIGLVLLPPQAPPELRFARDWSRVECLNPEADLELLDAFREEIAREAANAKTREALLKLIEAGFSNSLQASEYQACITPVPAQEADELARLYLETPRRSRAQRKAEQTIYQSLKSAFEQKGVWKGMEHKIAVSDYGIPDDPLEIDCGYLINSTIKMFHSTPLQANVNAAKVLAFSYPQLAIGIRSKKKAEPLLTAIIEDDLERDEEFGFAQNTLVQQGIHIATVADLPDLAATAAKEMGL
jgi:hypothetical protein